MGKPAGKKKIQVGLKSNDGSGKQKTSKAGDEDTAIFISMSQELKEEGNKLFQRRDHEGAMLTYEKALKLLPGNHIDVAYLRSNMAACYMQMGIGEYPRAVNECNLALQVAPKYSKALLKRAKCYEALSRLDLALKDVKTVLSIEPNNLSALELADSFKKTIGERGIQVEEKEIVLSSDYVEPAQNPVSRKIVKERGKKKKSNKFEKKSVEEAEEKIMKELEEKKTEDKEVIEEEKRSVTEEKVVSRSVKLVHGEDIRWAQLPVNCSVRLVRDVIIDRFPNLKGVLVKYKDQDGDLITVTTGDELRVAEGLADPEGILRLYVAEVSPDNEPYYDGHMLIEEKLPKQNEKVGKVKGNVIVEKESCTVEHWIPQFARIFKNHVGFDSDSCLDLHEIGMKLYSEAMEDSVTSEEAQKLFDISAEQFQEMAALAMFNWGNVHLSKARKKVFISEDNNSAESILLKVKAAYDWAKKEYMKAGMRYEEALKMKPDFYEGHLALGQQLYEQAKLSWYFGVGSKDGDLDIEETAEILELYNRAEDSMEKGMQIWEEMEEQRLNGLSKHESDKLELKRFGLDGLFKDVSDDEASKQAANMRSQIYLLWGTMLYERSVVEYKLTLPTWEECLEVAIEKFELAGALPTDIAVMIKNHCSNDTALEGFKVDEIVQAWNEMYDADRWRTGMASFRLEPLFRRRPPKLHSVLEHL